VIDLKAPPNAALLAYLADPARLAKSLSGAKDTPSCSPAAVQKPYEHLGTHPDLLSHFWDELGGSLPEDCRWVVYGTPALVHPRSGIAFGFAGGTHTYALRLPLDRRQAAIADGGVTKHEYPAYPTLGIQASSVDLAAIGPEWIFGRGLREPREWCRAAYSHAEAR
jgi:hypothetical protein